MNILRAGHLLILLGVFAGMASGATTVSVDTRSGTAQLNASPATVSHPVGDGTNRMLMIGVQTAAADGEITAVRYAGRHATEAGEIVTLGDDGAQHTTALYFMTEQSLPASGSHTVAVEHSFTGNAELLVSAVTLTGAAQRGPEATTVQRGNDATDIMTPIQTDADALLVELIGAGDPVQLSPATSQTIQQRVQPPQVQDSASVLATDQVPAGDHTLEWSVPTRTELGHVVTAIEVSDVPGIAGFEMANPSGQTLRVSFRSDVTLDDIRVAIDGPETATLDEDDFTRSGNTYTADLQVGADGEYTATLYEAVGPSGTDGARNQTDTISLDVLGPGISNITIEDMRDHNGLVRGQDTVRITASIDDSRGVASVTADASAFGAGAVSMTPVSGGRYGATFVVNAANAAADGDHTVTVRAQDTNGNTNTAESPLLGLDMTAPRVSALAARNPSGDTVDIRFVTSEELASVNGLITGPHQLSLDAVNLTRQNSIYSGQYTAPQDGVYTVRITRAEDAAGNVARLDAAASVAIGTGQLAQTQLPSGPGSSSTGSAPSAPGTQSPTGGITFGQGPPPGGGADASVQENGWIERLKETFSELF